MKIFFLIFSLSCLNFKSADNTFKNVWQFQGCRSSTSECRWSFQCKPILIEYDPELCEEKLEYEMDRYACYCLNQNLTIPQLFKK